MKKLKGLVVALVLCAMSFTLFACGDPKLKSIQMQANPTKTHYTVGQSIDVSGAKIKVIYEDDETEIIDVTAAMTNASKIDMSTAGQKTVTVTFTKDDISKTTSFNITVAPAAKTVASIALKEGTTFANVVEGTDLNLAQKFITVTYSDDTTADVAITAAMLSGFNKNTVGQQTITITYEGQTTTFNVTVDAKAVASIVLKEGTTFANVVEGTDLDLTNKFITVTYNNNTTADVAITAAMLSGFNKNTVGQQTVTITYETKTTTFNVTVDAASQVSEYEITGEVPTTVVAGAETDVSITLKTKVAHELGIDDALIYVDVTNKENVQLLATDTQGHQYNIADVGFWGPPQGFELSADYEATTPIKAIFAVAGDYTITVKVAKVSDPSTAIAEKVFNVTVQAKVAEVVGAESVVTPYASFDEAYTAAVDGDTIKLYQDVSLSTSLQISKDVTFDGQNQFKIKAADDFVLGNELNAIICINKTDNPQVKFANITIDGNAKNRIMKAESGKVVFENAVVTNGKNGQIAGLYFTNASQGELINTRVSGNVTEGKFATDGYWQFASDLWIGANAKVSISGTSEIDYAFCNANEYSANNKGGITLNAGTISNLYLEYSKGFGADFKFVDGTVTTMKIGKVDPVGTAEVVKAVAGNTYVGGSTTPTPIPAV